MLYRNTLPRLILFSVVFISTFSVSANELVLRATPIGGPLKQIDVSKTFSGLISGSNYSFSFEVIAVNKPIDVSIGGSSVVVSTVGSYSLGFVASGSVAVANFFHQSAGAPARIVLDDIELRLTEDVVASNCVSVNDADYRFAFNGMEKDDEIKTVKGGSYDFGSRIYDSRLGRWLSVDKYFDKFPSDATYMYCGDNPIYYVDPTGNWKVRWRDYNNHSAGIVFEAEPGDNLKTFAEQTGLPYQEILDENFGGADFTLNAPLEGGEWLRQEDLPGIETFQNINTFLKAGNDNPEHNCAAFCTFGVEGELDENWVSPSDMDKELNEAYTNVQSESDAKLGDVITLTETFEEFDFIWGYEAGGSEKSRKYYDENIKNKGAHYSLVLLKDPDGESIRFTIQKSGTTPIEISGYPGQEPSYEKGREGWALFEPNPVNGEDSTPIYRKKEGDSNSSNE